MDTVNEIELIIPDNIDIISVTGAEDENIKFLQDCYSARITLRGNRIAIAGAQGEIDSITMIFLESFKTIRQGGSVDIDQIRRLVDLTKEADISPSVLREDIILTYKGKTIRPKSAGQKQYIDAIRNNTITFGIGPAGTGKTYLAMAYAISMLSKRQMNRIILSRPIVEAGENLGFLPGSLTEKVDPYIRPLYDALFEMMDHDKANMLLETQTIEIAPLAFMRGRTLNDSLVILDEAQNTTPEQMMMFLTRLGFGSKMIITGDITQTDISGKRSGLETAKNILSDIDDIAFCYFDGRDVVRNPLVRKIIDAYEKHDDEEDRSKKMI